MHNSGSFRDKLRKKLHITKGVNNRQSNSQDQTSADIPALNPVAAPSLQIHLSTKNKELVEKSSQVRNATKTREETLRLLALIEESHRNSESPLTTKPHLRMNSNIDAIVGINAQICELSKNIKNQLYDLYENFFCNTKKFSYKFDKLRNDIQRHKTLIFESRKHLGENPRFEIALYLLELKNFLTYYNPSLLETNNEIIVKLKSNLKILINKLFVIDNTNNINNSFDLGIENTFFILYLAQRVYSLCRDEEEDLNFYSHINDCIEFFKLSKNKKIIGIDPKTFFYKIYLLILITNKESDIFLEIKNEFEIFVNRTYNLNNEIVEINTPEYHLNKMIFHSVDLLNNRSLIEFEISNPTYINNRPLMRVLIYNYFESSIIVINEIINNLENFNKLDEEIRLNIFSRTIEAAKYCFQEAFRTYEEIITLVKNKNKDGRQALKFYSDNYDIVSKYMNFCSTLLNNIRHISNIYFCKRLDMKLNNVIEEEFSISSNHFKKFLFLDIESPSKPFCELLQTYLNEFGDACDSIEFTLEKIVDIYKGVVKTQDNANELLNSERIELEIKSYEKMMLNKKLEEKFVHLQEAAHTQSIEQKVKYKKPKNSEISKTSQTKIYEDAFEMLSKIWIEDSEIDNHKRANHIRLKRAKGMNKGKALHNQQLKEVCIQIKNFLERVEPVILKYKESYDVAKNLNDNLTMLKCNQGLIDCYKIEAKKMSKYFRVVLSSFNRDINVDEDMKYIKNINKIIEDTKNCIKQILHSANKNINDLKEVSMNDNIENIDNYQELIVGTSMIDEEFNTILEAMNGFANLQLEELKRRKDISDQKDTKSNKQFPYKNLEAQGFYSQELKRIEHNQEDSVHLQSSLKKVINLYADLEPNSTKNIINLNSNDNLNESCENSDTNKATSWAEVVGRKKSDVGLDNTWVGETTSRNLNAKVNDISPNH